MIWEPLLLSLRVAALATVLVAAVGLAIALWLARSDFRGKSVVETLVTLPLILPPSVLGYYLLLVLGRGGPLDIMGLQIVFTWPAAVIASSVVALPLMVLYEISILGAKIFGRKTPDQEPINHTVSEKTDE